MTASTIGIHILDFTVITPTRYLKIALIRKSGWFFTSCKRTLEEDNLLEPDLAIDVKVGIDDRNCTLI